MTLPDNMTSKVFLAGRQASKGAAIAALSFVNSEVSQTQELQIPGATDVSHIFIDHSDTRPQLYGTAVSQSSQVGVWRFDLNIHGEAKQGSLVQVTLSSEADITGVLPGLRNKSEVHLVIQQVASNESVYVVYDFDTDSVLRAHKMLGLTSTHGLGFLT